jgi:Mn2+/Fe2+ NRAMP family transporter
MTKEELILLGIASGIGAIFGVAWAVFTERKSKGSEFLTFGAFFIPASTVLILLMLENGLAAVMLYPGLLLYVGCPSTLVALLTAFFRKKQLKSQTEPVAVVNASAAAGKTENRLRD